MSTALVEYSLELAEWIALEYSGGESLAELHRCHPDRVPAPLIVKRWRSRFPQFDELMAEAEAARAELLAEQSIMVADGPKKAANARNAIQARQWMAAALDRRRYGSSTTVNTVHSGAVDHKVLYELTDEQLMTIARGGVIEGELAAEPQAEPAPQLERAGPPAHPHAPPRTRTSDPQISRSSGSADLFSKFPKKFQPLTDPFD